MDGKQILILFVLYPTIGVLIQVAGVLIGIIEAEYSRMQEAPDAQQVGYAVSIGLLTLITLPIIVLAFPFYMLGEAARWLLVKLRTEHAAEGGINSRSSSTQSTKPDSPSGKNA